MRKSAWLRGVNICNCNWDPHHRDLFGRGKNWASLTGVAPATRSLALAHRNPASYEHNKAQDEAMVFGEEGVEKRNRYT